MALAQTVPKIEDITKKVISSVVSIETIDSSVKESPDRFFEFFSHPNMQVDSGNSKSIGTGFFVFDKKTILTNYHVVKDAIRIKIIIANGEVIHTAKIIKTDKNLDLALLAIQNPPYALNLVSVSKLQTKSEPSLGEQVLAIGNPFGLNHSVSLGIISAKNRFLPNIKNESFLQTDAAVNPGSSGGPLFNLKGEVVGINNSVADNGKRLGFAIPIYKVHTKLKNMYLQSKASAQYSLRAKKDFIK
jgi:serine protease Do